MTRTLFAGLATAGFTLVSAAAFAAGPTPPAPVIGPVTAAQPQFAAAAQPAAASPAPARPVRVAQQSKLKSCEKEWSAGEKGGKLHDMTRKAFLASCTKGA